MDIGGLLVALLFGCFALAVRTFLRWWWRGLLDDWKRRG